MYLKITKFSLLLTTLMIAACSTSTVGPSQVNGLNNSAYQPASDFRILPYVQFPAQSAMSILWFSEYPVAGILSYQKQGSPSVTSIESVSQRIPELSYSKWATDEFFNGQAPTAPYKHRIRIENLEAGTVYEYTVNQGKESFSSTFKTAPSDNSPIRVMIYGDGETEPESTGKHSDWRPSKAQSHLKLSPEVKGGRKYLLDQTQGYSNNLNVIKSRNPDLVIIAGDLVQCGGEQRDWDEFWRQNNNSDLKLASSVPIMPSIGNHEYYAGPKLGHSSQPASENAVKKYLTYFELPSNDAPRQRHQGRYYSFKYGPATFISIDVTNNIPEDSSQDTSFYLNGSFNKGMNKSLKSFSPGFSPKTRQYRWLKQALEEAQENSTFTFVSLHHSPYSSGPHGRPAGDGKGLDLQSGVPVRALTSLFMRYGVDAVLSGHDEMWERSEVSGEKVLSNGETKPHTIQFYDVGIGGDGLRRPVSDADNPFQKFIVNDDAPENWVDGELLSGGRHYGHMELDISINESNDWQATLKPIYVLPIRDENKEYSDYLRKSYDDEIVIIKQN